MNSKLSFPKNWVQGFANTANQKKSNSNHSTFQRGNSHPIKFIKYSRPSIRFNTIKAISTNHTMNSQLRTNTTGNTVRL